MKSNAYHLGCPIWANRAWLGSLYAEGTRSADFLARYAEVFSCVEGNSTFYALPTGSTVEKWVNDTPTTFRFAFKIPKTVTHERGLEGGHQELERFFETLAPLGERLGPFMVQLAPSFGPDRLGVLDAFLARLPAQHEYVVEVRHRAFFDEGVAEGALDEVLSSRRVGRCHFDTRPLFSGPGADPSTVATQTRKPRVSVRQSVLSGRPFIRFIGHNDVRSTTGWLDQWADTVAGWIGAGRQPYLFMHAPDDFYAPRLARAFHHLLRRRLPELPEHPPWPGEVAAAQLGLL